MKMRQAIAVLFAALLLIVPACRKTPEVLSSRYPWPVSGVAAADSAMLRLHDIIGRSGSLALLARRIDELAAESRRHISPARLNASAALTLSAALRHIRPSERREWAAESESPTPRK